MKCENCKRDINELDNDEKKEYKININIHKDGYYMDDESKLEGLDEGIKLFIVAAVSSIFCFFAGIYIAYRYFSFISIYK